MRNGAEKVTTNGHQQMHDYDLTSIQDYLTVLAVIVFSGQMKSALYEKIHFLKMSTFSEKSCLSLITFSVQI